MTDAQSELAEATAAQRHVCHYADHAERLRRAIAACDATIARAVEARERAVEELAASEGKAA